MAIATLFSASSLRLLYLLLLVSATTSASASTSNNATATSSNSSAAPAAATTTSTTTSTTSTTVESSDQTVEIDGWQFPSRVSLRAGVLHAPPFAILEERLDGSIVYSGFQIDMLESLKVFAKQDGVLLQVDLSPSPPNFNPALDLVANDCNTTKNPNTKEDCEKFDFIIANYYATPARCTRVALSPPWLRSTITTLKYVDKPPGAKDYTTLKEAEDSGAPICAKSGTFFATVVKAKFPKGNFVPCPTLEECIAALKNGDCVLSAEDELMSRYSMAWDPEIEVTREQFNTQYKVWPYSYQIPFEIRLLMEKWVRDANTNATLDELYSKYFQKSLCPVGTAGDDCDKPCDPIHGTSDKRGVCVCESTKWEGEDCTIEVEEELNLIPQYMIIIAYTMLGINVMAILLCALWLFWQRNSVQVRVSQPFFLALVLVGCFISSSTILALSQEDEGDGSVPACMAIPWLYSVGFSITFGTLFAKILRVYAIFKKAADNRVGHGASVSGTSRSNIISASETVGIIGGVLFVDCIILVVWTFVDPLQWERTVISADQFGAPLESEGKCVSENWLAFAAALAGLHLLLLATACCNLQIFIVGVPILIIIGSEPATSFFVRSTIIWMNDLCVVMLLFGNLMFSVHFKGDVGQDEVKRAVEQFTTRRTDRSAVMANSVMAKKSSSGDNGDLTSGNFAADSGHASNKGVTWKEDVSTTERGNDKNSILRGSQNSASKQPKKKKKPDDVLSRDSWASPSNPSTWEGGKRDDDHSSTVSDFEDEGGSSFHQDDGKPTDVLGNNKNSWAAVQISKFSLNYNNSQAADEDEDDEEATNDVDERRGSHSSLSLPPSNLPKVDKASHMSYAASRITKLRGEHAQYLAEKKSGKRSGGKVGTSG
ncbi:acid type B receptor subunit 2 [Seminavis robusta]|uniref:Acid type B receptor subunit 2 n=1 Tax=Seminavis robusta TaxID=568900 RepID=A0A9N8DLK2_9STRA|nr:acid type B receptor subunit 2 [Seminavis robusta]|eukprot:Sro212_g088070.1 acid type B receptor subunit 2 (885) ;mRNA; f:2330-5897